MKSGHLTTGWVFAVGMGVLYTSNLHAQPTLPVDYAVQVTAETDLSPPRIRLNWPRGRFDTSYVVSRKRLEERHWTELAQLTADSNVYVDSDVAAGRGYEYQIKKTTNRGFPGYGYIYSGIELPLVEDRGKVILLVESTHAEPLKAELSRLSQDLVGDGWQVVQVAVRPDIKVAEVKSVIRALYHSDPDKVKALFIIGHVPVPYSGNIFPDDHVHQGAWPADVYYSDMTGDWNWTDFVVNLRTRNYAANRNIPNDGKFDQSYPPAADLQAGRVDFWNLPVFQGRSEVDLLRAYLDKNHRFRHGGVAASSRGLIADFLPKGHVPAHTDGDADPVGNSGWRNFSAFFGPESIREAGLNEYLALASRESFLWSFGGSVSRAFDSTDAIASAADFAAIDLQVIFTMFVGGYYGDWNTPNNLLRAALGSGNVLTASYAGLPHWLCHPMALGETIGLSTRITQLNRRGGSYPPFNDGAGQVHIALMGDPTLRMHPVLPPADLAAHADASGVDLTWTASRQRALRGYYVYRASSPQGPFQRISGTEPVQQTRFRDDTPGAAATYMVRAVTLEQSASGTYFNGSQGIFATAAQQTGAPPPPSVLRAQALSSSEVLLTWTDHAHSETGFRIDRANPGGEFRQVAVVSADVNAFVDRERAPGTAYLYRVSAFNEAGSSIAATAETATLPAVLPAGESRASFVLADSNTRGTWTGRYGSEGYYVVTKEDVTPHGAGSIWPSDPIIPTFAAVQPEGKQTYIWSNSQAAGAGHPDASRNALRPMFFGLLHDDDHVEVFPLTTDPRALQRERGLDERMASAWYAPERFSINLQVDDSAPHRVSFYFLDWDRAGRVQTVRIFGQGQLLDSRTVSQFEEGIYYAWDIQGQVRVEFEKVSGPNALMMGMFFDPAGGPADPPPPSPPQVSHPPDPPADLAGSPVSASEILLRWTDRSSNEQGFRLLRRQVGTRDTQEISIGANATSYQDRGLAANTEYAYQIVAFNQAGISRASQLVHARTLPAQPESRVTLRVGLRSLTQLRILIGAPPETGWVLERSEDLRTWTAVTSGRTEGGESALDESLEAGQRFYRVRMD